MWSSFWDTSLAYNVFGYGVLFLAFWEGSDAEMGILRSSDLILHMME